MNIGIIGAGAIVKTVLSFIGEIEAIQIQAICATPMEKEVLELLSSEHNIPNYYTNVEEMLENDQVEVVYVAVPNHLHYQFTRQSLEAGKHVICEKPFTSNLREAEELIRFAEERQLIILEGVNTRYLPNALKIKEELKNLGKIKIVSMNYSQYSSRYDAFKEGNIMPAFNPKMSGGALMDLNIYNINFAAFLFGEPKRVSYEANIEKGIDTSGVLTLDYGDFKCVSVAAKDCKAPLMNTIQGDEGCIEIDSSLNLISNYKILMNKENEGSQMWNKDGSLFDFNHDKHQMYHEFVAFEKIIREKDYDTANKMLEITRTTMDIQTKARENAGIIFPADQELLVGGVN